MLKKIASICVMILICAGWYSLDKSIINEIYSIREKLALEISMELDKNFYFTSVTADENNKIFIKNISLKNSTSSSISFKFSNITIEHTGISIIPEKTPEFKSIIVENGVINADKVLDIKTEIDNLIGAYDPTKKVVSKAIPLYLKDIELNLTQAEIFKDGIKLFLTKGTIHPVENSDAFSLELNLLEENLNEIIVKGVWSASTSEGKFNIIADDAYLSEKFASKLNSKIYKLWDNYNPDGNVSASCVLTVANNKCELDGSLKLKGVKGLYDLFQYPVDNVSGLIRFTNNGAELCKVQGDCSDGFKFILTGDVQGFEEDASINVKIFIENIDITEKFLKASYEYCKELFDNFALTGKLSGICNIKRGYGKEEKTQTEFFLNLNDGVLTSYDFQYPLKNIKANFTYGNDELKIENFVSDDSDSSIYIAGVLKNFEFMSRCEANVKIQGRDILIDEKLINALPPEGIKLCNKIKPSGSVDVIWNISKEKQNKKAQNSVLLKLNGTNFNVENFPLEINDVFGEVEIKGDIIKFTNLYSKTMQVKDFDAQLPINLKDKSEISFELSKFDFDNKIVSVLPVKLQEIFGGIAIKEPLDCDLQIEFSNTNGSSDLRFTGVLRFQNNSFENLKCENIYGKIVFRGQFSGGKFSATGKCEISEMRLFKKKVRNLSAQVVITDNNFLVQDIRAETYKGISTGTINYDFKNKKYYSELTINSADLRDFILDTPFADKSLSGRFDASLKLEGNLSDLNTLKGNGSFEITKGELWEFPFFYNMLSFLTLSIPEGSRFETGKIKFDIENQKIKMKYIKFAGKSSEIKGKGFVDFNGNLYASVDAKFEKGFFQSIPIVKEVFEAFKSGVYKLQAEGNYTDPKFSLKPLPFLDEMFKSEENEK